MSLKHAILGFLSIHPMSGYDLKKAFDDTVGHFWTADQAQIYRTLASMVDDGLVGVTHVEQEGRPDRKEHHLTETGQIELDTWLAAPHGSQPAREPFLMQVFFVGRLGLEVVRQVLIDRIAEGEQQLAILQTVAAGVEAELAGRAPDLEQRLRIATLENGIIHTQAELDWTVALLEEISEEI